MSEKTYRAWRPDQAWLLPPSPRDWLPEGHLVYFLRDAVRELDISAITSDYERVRPAGHRPDESRMATRLPDPQPPQTLASRPGLIALPARSTTRPTRQFLNQNPITPVTKTCS